MRSEGASACCNLILASFRRSGAVPLFPGAAGMLRLASAAGAVAGMRLFSVFASPSLSDFVCYRKQLRRPDVWL